MPIGFGFGDNCIVKLTRAEVNCNMGPLGEKIKVLKEQRSDGVSAEFFHPQNK